MLILRFILINSIQLSLSLSLSFRIYVCVFIDEHDGESSRDSQRDSRRAEELIAYLSRSSPRHVETTNTLRNLSHRLHNRRSRCWAKHIHSQRDAYCHDLRMHPYIQKLERKRERKRWIIFDKKLFFPKCENEITIWTMLIE